jgi:16S rRNA G966 N2-methylase RsmD
VTDHVPASSAELDLADWRASDLLTDSLWHLGARDRSGPPLAGFYGAFVPQIPNQLLRRYTQPGDTVLDLFSGSGTTMGECLRLGRHGYGVDLDQGVLDRSRSWLDQQHNPGAVTITLFRGDATQQQTEQVLTAAMLAEGRPAPNLILLHPPYHDIIRFGTDPADLSNLATVTDYLAAMHEVAAQTMTLVAPRGHVALVMGDIYHDGELIPLAFLTMAVLQSSGLTLKAICLKDLAGNEHGKGKSGQLWRYRALKFGLYLMAHEYIFIFQRPPARRRAARALP